MKVLVVDDEPDLRLVIRVALAATGSHIVEASGGAEGLTAIAQHAPNIVLLDVQMPDMSGWEVLAAIRGVQSTEGLPVLMCTVKSSPEDQVRAWEAGCDGYVVKPYEIDDVIEQIERLAHASPGERDAIRAEGLALAKRRLEEIERSRSAAVRSADRTIKRTCER